MCIFLLENLLSFGILGNFFWKFRYCEDNLCEVNPTPTSFGRWYMKHQLIVAFKIYISLLWIKKKLDGENFLWSLLKTSKQTDTLAESVIRSLDFSLVKLSVRHTANILFYLALIF